MKLTIASLQHQQTLVRILMFTFVTVLVWIGFSLFQSQQQTGIDPALLKLAQPLDPNINLDVITRIQQKRSFTQAELSSFPINRIVTLPNGDQVIVQSDQQANSLLFQATQSAQQNPFVESSAPPSPINFASNSATPATSSAKK